MGHSAGFNIHVVQVLTTSGISCSNCLGIAQQVLQGHTKKCYNVNNDLQPVLASCVVTHEVLLLWLQCPLGLLCCVLVYLATLCQIAGKATDYRLDTTAFESRQEKDILSSPQPSRQAIGSTQPLIQSLRGFFLRVNTEPKVDRQRPSSAEAKNEWSHTSAPLVM